MMIDKTGQHDIESNITAYKAVHLDRVSLDHRYGYYFTQRLFDIVASSIGLIILAIPLLIIAIMIKRDDPQGPVFYSQIRLGKHQRLFKMYKFRSMVVDADKKLAELLKYNEVDGAMFKMKKDPRVTLIGRFIRKYSIDELPQLINVLKGDIMSLVGPRPPLEREVATYSEYAKQRLYVKPGCTGLWQVSGRNSVGFDEMVELDLQYIEKSSFWFDLKIMFMTVKIMIWPNSAY